MKHISITKFENLHMGGIVLKILREKKISKAQLARRLNKTPVSVNSYLKQQTLQARIIFNISIALEYDFFEHLSNILNENNNIQAKVEENLALKNKIIDLEKEVNIYKDLLKR